IDDLRSALDELEEELRSRRRGAQAAARAPTTAIAESSTHAA
ncbi:MAG: hypothetical protein QOG35_2215, partial [Solirubrobacteraceae bacterium]|nr:hypothetical protein [Solirubrobacteraceae bacterium]